jgi:purine-binding chemotaxis protein CheW
MIERKESEELYQLVIARIGKEEYGIPINQIQEIIRIPEIIHIPEMPDFIEGIINLRDKIILMIDLRKRFGLPAERSEKARIIIARPSEISTEKQYETESSKSSIGLIVDSVSEVIRLSSQQIDNVPQVYFSD